ncbi:TPA: hypothetical protein GXZ34_05050 [bacterium]|nr:hypothetical protein [bacterium]
MKILLGFIFTIFSYLFRDNLVLANLELVDLGYDKVISVVSSYNNEIIVYEVETNYECNLGTTQNIGKCRNIVIYNSRENTFRDYKTNNDQVPDGYISFPSIDKYGNYLTFTSNASNILETMTSEKNTFVYLYDIRNNKSIMLTNKGSKFNNDSYLSKISADSKYIVFESIANNNISKVENVCKNPLEDNYRNCLNIYHYSIEKDEYILVNTKNSNGDSFSPSISEDGRYVTFTSLADNLTSDTYLKHKTHENYSQIFYRDTRNSGITLISKNNNGESANGFSRNAILSDNGKYIAYETTASNLIDNDYNANIKIIIYSLDNNKNYLVTKNIYQNKYESYLDGISSNGLLLIYRSKISNIVEGVNEFNNNLYIYNFKSNKTSLISEVNDQDILLANISGDGKKINYYNENRELYLSNSDLRAPVIEKNQVIVMLISDTKDFKSKINVTDDLTRKEDLEFICDDLYDFYKIGIYEIQVTFRDEQGNVSEEIVTVEIIKEDNIRPVFEGEFTIRILRGSDKLYLLDYVKVSDNVDHEISFTIVDYGELNLNLAGEYKIKLQASDSSNNISYQEIKVIVYREYNLSYFLEILVILSIFGVIVFSTIRGKIK